MSTPLKSEPLSSAIFVRLSPQLHELAKRGAEAEERGLGAFVRDAVIFRLAALGLVPVVAGDGEDDDE